MSDAVTARRGQIALAQEGDRGRLSSPAADVPVSIASQQGDTLLLSLLIKAETELTELPEPVLLECTSSRGLVRFHGQAEIEDGNLVRFRVIEEPEVVQRRRFVRIFAPQPVALSSEAGQAAEAHTINVSGGGMLLSGGAALQLGDVVRFRLHLSADDTPVQGMARVVRDDELGHQALVFEDISEDDRERLIHFIFERMRAARARTRDDGR